MATKQVNGKGQNSIHSPHRNPLTDLYQNWHAWLRHGRNPTCKNL